MGTLFYLEDIIELRILLIYRLSFLIILRYRDLRAKLKVIVLSTRNRSPHFHPKPFITLVLYSALLEFELAQSILLNNLGGIFGRQVSLI